MQQFKNCLHMSKLFIKPMICKQFIQQWFHEWGPTCVCIHTEVQIFSSIYSKMVDFGSEQFRGDGDARVEEFWAR